MSAGIPWSPTAYGEGYAGKGRYYQRGQIPSRQKEPWERTCPQYFARSPAVASVLELLDDYEGGRVDIMTIPGALLHYLRVASNERKGWGNFWDAKLMPDVKSGR